MTGTQRDTGLSAPAVWREEEGYEHTRDQLVWQQRKPERFPEVIVTARDVDDVVEAVRWAAATGRRISARSGGHSWAGSSLRDGGVLLDLGALDGVSVDTDRMRASVGPAAKGQRLDALLAEHGLFFPVGHCPTVGLGGFLLGGGYGWWSHHFGQACLNVEAVDVVTPAGQLLRADAEHNTDWFWAARGAGPGFFGIVVGFHLRLHRRPPVIAETSLVLDDAERESVFRWAWEARRDLDDHVEFAIVPTRIPEQDGSSRRAIAVAANAIGNSMEEAEARLQPITSCPLADRALVRMAPRQTTLAEMFEAQDRLNPPGRRYAVDNMWTSAPVEDVLGLIDEAYDSLPTGESFLLWYHWVPQQLPDAALSSQGEIWISAYAIYEDSARDEECQRWVTELMRRHEGISSGTQISDENLRARFHLPLSAAGLERLDALRRRHDPTDRTHGLPRPGS